MSWSKPKLVLINRDSKTASTLEPLEERLDEVHREKKGAVSEE